MTWTSTTGMRTAATATSLARILSLNWLMLPLEWQLSTVVSCVVVVVVVDDDVLAVAALRHYSNRSSQQILRRRSLPILSRFSLSTIQRHRV
jgi:hypothetical protein